MAGIGNPDIQAVRLGLIVMFRYMTTVMIEVCMMFQRLMKFNCLFNRKVQELGLKSGLIILSFIELHRMKCNSS